MKPYPYQSEEFVETAINNAIKYLNEVHNLWIHLSGGIYIYAPIKGKVFGVEFTVTLPTEEEDPSKYSRKVTTCRVKFGSEWFSYLGFEQLSDDPKLNDNKKIKNHVPHQLDELSAATLRIAYYLFLQAKKAMGK